MNEWLKIIQERDDRIKELETNYQKWSNEDRETIARLKKELSHMEHEKDVWREKADLIWKDLQTNKTERDNLKGMIEAIAKGQNPVHVLTQGMAMVIERDQKIAQLTKESQANYEHLQNVMSVRDALLTHVYTLLDRPNGIMLHDMPDAIQHHKAYIAQLEAEIRAAKQSDEDSFGSMTCHRRS